MNFYLFHYYDVGSSSIYVTLDHKTCLKSHGYVRSNSQQYIVCVIIIYFSFVTTFIRILSKEHVLYIVELCLRSPVFMVSLWSELIPFFPFCSSYKWKHWLYLAVPRLRRCKQIMGISQSLFPWSSAPLWTPIEMFACMLFSYRGERICLSLWVVW